MRARLTILLAALAAAPALAAQQRTATPPPAVPAQQPAPRPAAPVSAAAQRANQRPGAAAPAGAAAQRPARPDSAQQDTTALPIEYRREVYNYGGGARDPFASLLTDASAQATINDLRLVSVLYDARGGRSVAVVRDKNNPHPYRLRRGETIGRLRVIQIRPYEVVFQVEEFGFERQEVLTLQRPEVNR